MNIRVSNILKIMYSQFFSQWKKILLNSLLGTVISFVAIVSIFGCLLSAIYLVVIGIAGGGFVLWIFVPIAIIFLFVVMMFASFMVKMLEFTIADSSINQENRIRSSVKNSFTTSNFKFYALSVYIPVAILTILWTSISIVLMLFNFTTSVVWIIIGGVASQILGIYISSKFTMGLYSNYDAKAGASELLSKYTRKQIFGGYFNQTLTIILFNIIAAAVSGIPIIGILVQVFFTILIRPLVIQGMILSIGGDDMIKQSQSEELVSLKSDRMEIEINRFGAQISSVQKNNCEYMWQADPAYWGRSAPVLFPFVGKLKDNQYQIDDEYFTMNQHGFLRDRVFNVISQSANSVTFEYTSNITDYELYPFDFTVRITYTISGSVVSTNYEVINNSDSVTMPFQIGAHPAFNVDSVDNLSVEFPSQDVTQHFFENGFQKGTAEAELSSIDLSYALINENLPCYSDFKSHRMMLKQNGLNFIGFEFETMDYLAIWSPEHKNAKFICIEPWNGICARLDQVGYKLEDKDGMKYLNPGMSHRSGYKFEIY